jgi:hypothetical protein
MRFVAPVLHIAVGPPLQSRVSSRGVDRLLGTIGRGQPPAALSRHGALRGQPHNFNGASRWQAQSLCEAV